MTAATKTVRVPNRFQGPTGTGQGGWTAFRLAEQMDTPATVAIRAPIPLETDLNVVPPPAGGESTTEPWRLVAPDETVILEATAWDADCPDTEPVSIDAAESAHQRFLLPGELHPVPFCFVCGLQPETMHVQSGPLGDGRFATPWTVPAWAADRSGSIDPAIIWGALDCTAAMFVGCEGGIRSSVTAQIAVDILAPFTVGETYALVAWPGHWTAGGWDGRKRGAASAAFDADGRCVARSTSFWIALE